MSLQVYVDRLSQPSRAILIFCKVNGLDFEEIRIDLSKGQHRTPEYAAINPMKQVPSIVHGDFKLSESHAILVYLASAFPSVADHWYPSDVRKRAKIHMVLDWHHTNLRRGSVDYIFNTRVGLVFGVPLDHQAAIAGKKLLLKSFATIETHWLEQDQPFLHGNSEPSIADLAFVCEITQLELAEESVRDDILGPHKRISKWIEDTKNATAPYFDEIHSMMALGRGMLSELQAKLSKQGAPSK